MTEEFHIRTHVDVTPRLTLKAPLLSLGCHRVFSRAAQIQTGNLHFGKPTWRGVKVTHNSATQNKSRSPTSKDEQGGHFFFLLLSYGQWTQLCRLIMKRVFLWWNITTGGCGLSASLRPIGFPQAPAVVGHLDLRTICMFSSTFFNPFILLTASTRRRHLVGSGLASSPQR